MDVEIAGLNKLVCRTTLANDGKTVSVTNGTNTWSSEVTSTIAAFMIPSMPAPAKTTYTVTLHDGNIEAAALYTRDIELGFGDSIDITLDEAHEPATKGDIATAIANLQSQINTINTWKTSATSTLSSHTSTLSSHTSTLSAHTTSINSLKNKNLVYASKSGTTLTLTKFTVS